MTPPRVPAALACFRIDDATRKQAKADIPAALALLHGPDDIVEWRIPDANRIPGKVTAGFVPMSRVARHASEIVVVAGDSVAIYFTIHRIDPSCLVRSPCRFAEVSSHGGVSWPKLTCDDDVIERLYLFIDIDPAKADGHKGDSATDAEKGEALNVANSVQSVMRELGWPEPVVIDSGNGYHLYYPLPTPITRANFRADLATPAVYRVLKLLGHRCNTAGATIDPSVCNPSRVAKMPGTTARKGVSTADRPHRLSRVVSVPDGWGSHAANGAEAAASLEALADALDPDGTIFAALKAKDSPKASAATSLTPGSHSPADLPPLEKRIARATKYIAKMPAGIQGQDGSGATYAVAAALVHGFYLDDHSAMDVMGDYNARCVPPWSEAELRHKVADAAEKKHDKPRGYLLTDKLGKPAAVAPAHGLAQPAPVQGMSATPPAAATRSRGLSADGAGLNEADDDQHRLARAVLEPFTSAGRDTLGYWQGDVHSWDGTAYVTHPEDEFRADVTQAIRGDLEASHAARLKDAEAKAQADGAADVKLPVMPRVTQCLVGNVVGAIKGMRRLKGVESAPAWIGAEGGPDPREIVATRNGLVHLPTYAGEGNAGISPHTPHYFNFNVADYHVDSRAPTPAAWLAFLASLWPDDTGPARHLQEWMGYLLTPDNSRQKVLMLIGAEGSGKGTIARVIRQLVGYGNCASPSVESFCGPFGVAPLIGKSVAVFEDVKIDNKTPMAILMGRLLTISGGGQLEINRKNRPHHNGRLNTRLVMSMNNPPNFGDSAKAMSRRWSILNFVESFKGREDINLEHKLHAELAGIFNWAVEGWTYLNARGHFAEPDASKDVATELREIGSPVAVFIDTFCKVGTGETVACDELYNKWCEYRSKSGIKEIVGRQEFGSKLREAVPSIGRGLIRVAGKRVKCYRGITLHPLPDDADRTSFEKSQARREPTDDSTGLTSHRSDPLNNSSPESSFAAGKGGGIDFI